MFKYFFRYISRGIEIVRNNPQLFYTVFLMLAIPLAFLVSGQKFLQIATDNQERLEKEGIGLAEDSFVAAASDRMNDPEFLERLIQSLKQQNKNITEFTVVQTASGTPTVIASLDKSLVGKQDAENSILYGDLSGMTKENSVIVPVSQENGREWKAFRSILNSSGMVLGYAVASFSMASIDNAAFSGILSAYGYLAIIVVLILLLLARQARVIDYTALYRKLKEVDQMKDDFLSMAAHELRTPLTIIRGYAEALKDAKNLDEKNTENVRRIDVSAMQLNILVGDILDVSRLEQGRMNFQFTPTDPCEIAKNSADSFEIVAKEKGLAISCEVAENVPKISVDQTRLSQVLTNLVGNSIKYTPAGSITIKVSYIPEKKQVSIRVSDTGLGISSENMSKLFGKFFRIKRPETSNIQGTGLGLWITHRIITEMNGTITAESIEGKGSDFIVSFPGL
ncbi:MAG: HAMP domain-containing sensor histidine kinase [Candidatus Paceibacterota bacterium]|jgi:signal transduction histidine kinase